MSINLPAIPTGSTIISDVVSVDNQNGVWTYWVYLWPIYTHERSQRKQFRYIAATLINSGLCKQIEIVRAFGVDRKMLGRAQQQPRERGAESFFQTRPGRKGGTILTEERPALAQQLLNEGASRAEVSRQLQIKADTLRKALNDGRLTPAASSADPSLAGASTLSGRAQEDARAGEQMGVAATNPLERVGCCLNGPDRWS